MTDLSDSRTLRRLALKVQDACNPSGVARFLVRAIDAVDGGTDAKRQDPAVRLIVAKLADMCGLDYTWPRDAADACEVTP